MGKEQREKLVYCGSDVIEQEHIENSGAYEYPDGVFVKESECKSCPVNCPNNSKGYTQVWGKIVISSRYTKPWA